MSEDYRREHRIFRVWQFSTGHNQLFLRSEPTAIEGTKTRAEIYFGNVQIMFVRPVYQGVHVREMSEVERRASIERFGLELDIDGGFYLIAPGLADFVVCSAPAWREGARTFDDPSLFDLETWPPGDDIEWGTVE
jgi:hypothetical protein